MNYLALSIIAPLVTAGFILLVGKRVSASVIPILAIMAVFLSLFSSIILLLNSASGLIQEIILTGLPNYPLKLIASPLTSILLTMVTLISALVMVYANGYMQQEKHKTRFFAIMLLFITAMQTLVVAGDWILLLSAWELIGLSSYLLIGFWFQKKHVKAAATRAFLVTRTADLGLYLAIFMLIASSGSSDIQVSLNDNSTTSTLAGILLLIAAMGKSAQTPMHDWLQRAMAGPTPVSALLHSATLVAAGAILLIRVAPLLSTDALFVIGLVGGITTVVTGMIALGENDLKRLLAASTSSQYGLMFLAIGAGYPIAALLHLLAHAAIKSSLFMAAGVFQHSRKDTKFSALIGVGRDKPLVFIGFVVSALALSGIPPLSGFFSKDAIITATLTSNHMWIFLPLALLGTLLTGAYMAKAVKLLWSGSAHSIAVHGSKSMSIGFITLVIFAAILGFTFKWVENVLAQPLELDFYAMSLGLISALSGILLGWYISDKKILGVMIKPARTGFAIAGGIDKWIVRPTLVIANICDTLEKYLYRLALNIGKMTVKIAHDKVYGILENYLYQLALGVGKIAVKIAQLSKSTDNQWIDKFIYFMVRMFIKFSHYARAIQSGLIHRELALSAIITGGIVVTLFIMIAFY